MIKKRNWSFIAYPESLPKNWKDIIAQTGLPFAISPLHDKDLDKDGNIKKPHYHVILCYDGPTTYKNVCSLVCDQLGQPRPQVVESVRGYYHYFTHIDELDKATYNEEAIQTFNCFDELDLLTAGEVLSYLKQIQVIINENGFVEYSDLLDFLLDHDFDLWKVASNHTIFLNTYLTSLRHRSTISLDNKKLT